MHCHKIPIQYSADNQACTSEEVSDSLRGLRFVKISMTIPRTRILHPEEIDASAYPHSSAESSEILRPRHVPPGCRQRCSQLPLLITRKTISFIPSSTKDTELPASFPHISARRQGIPQLTFASVWQEEIIRINHRQHNSITLCQYFLANNLHIAPVCFRRR